MLKRKQSIVLVVVILNASVFRTTVIYSAQQQGSQVQNEQVGDAKFKALTDRTNAVLGASNNAVLRSNEAMAYSLTAHVKAHEAFQKATEASRLADKISTDLAQAQQIQERVMQQAQTATENLGHVVEGFKNELTAQAREERKLKVEEQIRIGQAVKQLEIDSGIHQKTEIAGKQEELKNIKEILADPQPLIKIGAAIVIVALCVYGIEYGMPLLIDHFKQPHVISETSARWWFQWSKLHPNIDINDLIFPSSLQEQLSDLLLRVQTAKAYNEGLPNVLFHGAPGTGKTAFVRALAYASGLDYALTSGSEFAKITDLNSANNELRNLLNWAKKSKKGLIIFIDEAESLFANRTLSTTAKATQDFINTFLSLVSEQSQKNVMFVFATNHPSWLDDAVTNRIGTIIEFTLPKAHEREKILFMYLVKFAEENKKALVEVDPELMPLLPKYAETLEGFSPRAIKFIAGEMISKARRRESKQLTDDIVQSVIEQAKHGLQKTMQWGKERNERIGVCKITQGQIVK